MECVRVCGEVCEGVWLNVGVYLLFLVFFSHSCFSCFRLISVIPIPFSHFRDSHSRSPPLCWLPMPYAVPISVPVGQGWLSGKCVYLTVTSH